MPAAATAGAISFGAIMADPILPRARIIPAAEATAVEVTVAEAARAAEEEEAISGRRCFTWTGMVGELFPNFFRFIPV